MGRKSDLVPSEQMRALILFFIMIPVELCKESHCSVAVCALPALGWWGAAELCSKAGAGRSFSWLSCSKLLLIQLMERFRDKYVGQ